MMLKIHEDAVQCRAGLDHLFEMYKKEAKEGEYLKWDGGSLAVRDHEVDGWAFGEYGSFEDWREAVRKGEPLDEALEEYDKRKLSNVDLLKYAGKPKKRRRKSEEGSELDIDILMAGDPQHWIKKGSSQKPVARIAFDVAATSGYPSEYFIERTATAVALMEIAEMKGYATELYACTDCKGTIRETEKLVSCQILLKTADERTDVMKLLALSAPGLFRGLNFLQFLLCAHHIDKSLEMGLGRPTKLDVKERPSCKYNEFDYFIAGESNDLEKVLRQI